MVAEECHDEKKYVRESLEDDKEVARMLSNIVGPLDRRLQFGYDT